MAGIKRKAPTDEVAPSIKKKSTTATAAASRPRRSTGTNSTSVADEISKASSPNSGPKKTSIAKSKAAGKAVGNKVKKTAKGKASDESLGEDNEAPPSATKNKASVTEAGSGGGKSYWLMKAEPESRIQNGIDVKFSIHDLEARTEPEPWDGVRNYVARNNMRAMSKGDLAFFYHSNCKTPGIVGIMEIVQEHSPDESALDPKHPYYDPKETKENPKWSVVHVGHRITFDKMIPLKELQQFKGEGQPLSSMQLLKMSRLSVSKVSQQEWDFILQKAGARVTAADGLKITSGK